MRARHALTVPAEHGAKLRRAVKVQWLSIGLLLTVIGVMGMVTGTSQAMRSAWMEDLLSLVPPIAFLIASRYHRKPPGEQFPYGHHRVMTIAFLVASTALCAFGTLLTFNAIAALAKQEHPTIGVVALFGHDVWQGWLMMAALVYSIIPPVLLGRVKLPLARALHAKALHADAQMNKADWTTGLAAIVGIVGVGFGLWWADALAAGVISFSVLHDGVRSLRTAVADLMDAVPRPVDDEESFDVVERLTRHLDGVDWVKEYDVRLREEGDVCVGEIYVVPRTNERLPERTAELAKSARAADWRLYDLVVTPLPSLERKVTDS